MLSASISLIRIIEEQTEKTLRASHSSSCQQGTEPCSAVPGFGQPCSQNPKQWDSTALPQEPLCGSINIITKESAAFPWLLFTLSTPNVSKQLLTDIHTRGFFVFLWRNSVKLQERRWNVLFVFCLTVLRLSLLHALLYTVDEKTQGCSPMPWRTYTFHLSNIQWLRMTSNEKAGQESYEKGQDVSK